MNIEKIKRFIKNNIGTQIEFKFNGARNQIEEFGGEIISAYNSIFIVKLNNNDVIRSFAYTDVLIGNLEICL